LSDVRDDGGSLSTVVDIAGLFIEQVLLFKSNQQEERRSFLFDRDKK
jgi:carboxyl-terminal processing protease